MLQALRERPALRIAALMAPGAFWLLLFFLAPLTIMGAISFLSRDAQGFPALPYTLENYWTIVRDIRFAPSLSLEGGLQVRLFEGLYLDLLWRSIWLSLISTLITLLLAFPVALFMAQLPKRYRNLALFAVMIPFWTNFLVRTYALQFMLRANGPINTVLRSLGLPPLELIFTPTAVMIGLVYGNLPFMILPLYTSLEKFDWTMMEAAHDLGADTWRAFTRVMLPLISPGLVAGSILTFVPAIGSYITVDLMGGGRTNLIGYSIAQQFSASVNWPFGSALALVMMVIVTIAAVLYFRSSRGMQRAVI
ncbi:MAG: ABC transporter permease [Thermoflexales bacterium]|nr:ABC transporter permease [Thermoflexales bacterium]MCS7325542.1 ABC transporter permease [Thermoflexales bacterium]MCX7937980.1 ABC transporter permease [Thermoflexales bacterium]MDW8053764.1 ABC transporter permease [Anaerolineae bacterium]MDW8293612.1 ABC transporter permease [Anaerolineae bacterium]